MVVVALRDIKRQAPWRPDTLRLARATNWNAVCAAAVRVVRAASSNWPADSNVDAAAEQLEPADREGFNSLFLDPIAATAHEIYNGSNRLAVMREQGVELTVIMEPVV